MKERTTIGLPIDKELKDKINNLAPRGMKAEAIRALLRLLLETQIEFLSNGRSEFVVDHLIRGRCKLIVVGDDD